MPNPLQDLLERLQSVRDKYGEQAYNDAAKDIARQLIAQGGEEAVFAKEAFKDVPGIDEPMAVGDDGPLPHQLLNLVRQSMPGIKSQAQFDAFMSAFEGLRMYLNGIFEHSEQQEADGRRAMDQAIDAARKVTELTEKLEEVPEAATSAAAEKFKTPPAEFEESEIYQDLITELAELVTLTALTKWYDDAKPRLAKIVTQRLRNSLFDSIRRHKADLQDDSRKRKERANKEIT
jgi:hypothetical protein